MAASLHLPGFAPERPARPRQLQNALRGLVGPASLRPRASFRGSSRAVITTASLAERDPWKVLGVPHNASEDEIKRAHRSLVKLHHPDLAGSPTAQADFLRIQKAYEILTGKHRGKEIDPGTVKSGDQWDFHDWFWSFSMRRRRKNKSGYANDTESSPPPREAMRSQWRQQLHGLKAKAASKRVRQARESSVQAHSTVRSASEQAAPQQSAAAGSVKKTPTDAAEKVWRSTTRNARRSASHQAAASNASAAKMDVADKPRVHFVAPAADANAPSAAPPATTTVQAGSAIGHTSRNQSFGDFDTSSSREKASTSAGNRDVSPAPTRVGRSVATASNNVRRWDGLKSLFDHAAHAVHDARRRHEAAFHTHVSTLRHKLVESLDAYALHQLISLPDVRNAAERTNGARITDSPVGTHAFSAESLRLEFEDVVCRSGDGLFDPGQAMDHHSARAQFVSARARARADIGASVEASAPGAGAGAAPEGMHSDAYPMDEHSRKFADRSAVEERLGTQLAGLRRRSLLKKNINA